MTTPFIAHYDSLLSRGEIAKAADVIELYDLLLEECPMPIRVRLEPIRGKVPNVYKGYFTRVHEHLERVRANYRERSGPIDLGYREDQLLSIRECWHYITADTQFGNQVNMEIIKIDGLGAKWSFDVSQHLERVLVDGVSPYEVVVNQPSQLLDSSQRRQLLHTIALGGGRYGGGGAPGTVQGPGQGQWFTQRPVPASGPVPRNVSVPAVQALREWWVANMPEGAVL
jgi:hypothetical protein